MKPGHLLLKTLYLYIYHQNTLISITVMVRSREAETEMEKALLMIHQDAAIQGEYWFNK